MMEERPPDVSRPTGLGRTHKLHRRHNFDSVEGWVLGPLEHTKNTTREAALCAAWCNTAAPSPVSCCLSRCLLRAPFSSEVLTPACGGHDGEFWVPSPRPRLQVLLSAYEMGPKDCFPWTCRYSVLRWLSRSAAEQRSLQQERTKGLAAALASHLCNPNNPSQQADILAAAIRIRIPARDGAFIPRSSAILLSTAGIWTPALRPRCCAGLWEACCLYGLLSDRHRQPNQFPW
ncbi:hypothetical protein N657DRAFT_399617 [Parathielavia appendiculata]|uniref:Uncharacterized protein n=1 Tax=Parathielavia appendiculata TaxID=2587402 RepID=A0AAN6Z584_9PEZI|nr:hypothetical protein N657DRAFT_399617 [Parathielavia appendiculata]